MRTRNALLWLSLAAAVCAVPSLAQARVVLEEWRRDYNTERPHSALGNLTPIAYAARNASVPQKAEVLRSPGGFAPRPVATPDPIGPNDERILLATG